MMGNERSANWDRHVTPCWAQIVETHCNSFTSHTIATLSAVVGKKNSWNIECSMYSKISLWAVFTHSLESLWCVFTKVHLTSTHAPTPTAFKNPLKIAQRHSAVLTNVVHHVSQRSVWWNLSKPCKMNGRSRRGCAEREWFMLLSHQNASELQNPVLNGQFYWLWDSKLLMWRNLTCRLDKIESEMGLESQKGGQSIPCNCTVT